MNVSKLIDYSKTKITFFFFKRNEKQTKTEKNIFD